jgi:CubicO group peptidase (beta-lactamase class C family)
VTVRRAGVSLGLVVAVGLGACTSNDGTEPTTGTGTTTTSVGGRAPDPATAVLDLAKAAPLEAVLAKVVRLNATIPDADTAARGITAAVVTDKWTWSSAVGVDAAGTRLVPTTMLGAASITKTFIAAEVVLLAKAGKLDLDAPLAQYVPHRLTRNNATVRQHLAMRSGVPDFLEANYVKFDQAVAVAPGRHWTAEQALAYHTAPVQPPDSPFNYSNASYLLLGLLIERVSGQPLATALRRDLAQPAGLERAAFQDGEKPPPPLAEDRNPVCGKAVDGFAPCRAFASAVGAAGSLAADAPTLARWGYELYGGRVGPSDLVRELTDGVDYGLGTFLFTTRFGNYTAYGHPGELPDYTTMLVAVPERRLSVALMVADGGKDADQMIGELIRAAVQLLGT